MLEEKRMTTPTDTCCSRCGAANHRKYAVSGNLSVSRSTENRKVISGGAISLPYQHRNPVFGESGETGSVLYLALEDTHQRLQERFDRMFGEKIEGELFLSVSAKQLGKGLQEQMKEFVSQHKNATLIVIDTLQKVREVN